MEDCLRAVITNLFVYFLVRKRIIERDTFKGRYSATLTLAEPYKVKVGANKLTSFLE